MIAAEFYRLALAIRKQNLNYINSRLSKLPCVKLGVKMRGSKRYHVARYSEYIDGKRITHEYFLTSPCAQDLLSKMAEADALRERLDRLMYREELDPHSASESSASPLFPSPFNRQAFDALKERNDPDVPRNNPYNGRFFRSKSEVMLAQCLEELGLEYKYEVFVKINGESFYVDFAVYCPETGRFFFIEHFGKMDEANYSIRSLNKTSLYLNSGMKEGYDILFTYENTNGGINIEVVKLKILCVLAAHATIFIK